MSSPFPGMDPCLEEPAVWSSVHVRLINAISDYLSPRLLPHFFVDIQQHVYLVTPADIPGDPIDLQFVFDEMYARAYYAESIDYTTTAPAPRLTPADQQWVQTKIKQWQSVRG